jgi:hypothetical protein
VYGVGYPYLRKNEGVKYLSPKTNYCYENKKIIDFETFRSQFYNDEAVRLSVDDINKTVFHGIPLLVNHKKDKKVGHVISAWQCKKVPSNVIVMAAVTDDETIKQVDSGKYTDFSFFYENEMQKDENGWKVNNRNIQEISLCERGYMPNCSISVRLSKDDDNRYSLGDFEKNLNNFNYLYFTLIRDLSDWVNFLQLFLHNWCTNYG